MWMISSTSRQRFSSHSHICSGGTKSPNGCLPMLRHLPVSVVSRRSQTTRSRLWSSASLATMFEPMNPAPPVTKTIRRVMRVLTAS